jgi:F0F1-type ATP synthase membrane subunit b/b'
MNVYGKFIRHLIVGDCEKRIDEYRARVRSQQELIRTRRAEAVNLKQEADRCRAEADSCAIL